MTLTSEDLKFPSLPDAACKDLSLAESEIVFFHSRPSYAKKIYCDTCPVKAECLQWALDTDAYGTWAGTGRKERLVILKMLGHRPI